jgi:eukaryotic-like serine/threonine-protein kinase
VTPERWKQVEALFEQALEVPAKEQAAFLQTACNGDEDLKREVESFLDSHARAGGFIDRRSLFVASEEIERDDVTIASGQLIGPYRAVRELGRGGMGTVYLAERADEQYQKRVAIKLIKRGMDTDAVLRHFRNERQILASFDHPNIARLFDAGTTADGLPYFVMEYVEGVPIDKYCDAHGLSIVERLKLFREVCASVTYAHRHAVIHRDIKSSNILITIEGVPKLLDFGIAKALQPADGSEPLMTATGLRAMTPEYASPEQVRSEPLTTATDVYSLGIVLYELLTGKLPYRFASRSPMDVARAITEQEPTRPSTAVAKHGGNSKFEIRKLKLLKGDLDNIALMALRKEPGRRYQSVEQLSQDIRRHVQNRPVLARKDTVGYRALKFVQRNQLPTAAAVLILVSLVAGLVATTWQAHRATVQKNRAERRFDDVRRLAHSVLFDYHDAIKDLPGATHARERLVKDALTYLDSLAAEAADDSALQRELAAAYERVGDVRGQAYSASLGDGRGALDSYLKSLRIREALVAAAPNDVQSRRDLAASYRKIGNQMLETSEALRGFEYLQKALALYFSFATEQPGDSTIRSELAGIYNDVGLGLEDRGDMAGALEHHRKAIKLREQLLNADRGNARARRDLSVSYVNAGRALYLSGRVADAIEINVKAIQLRQSLVAEDPTNADYRRLLAIGYQNDGDYRAPGGDINGALESFQKKFALDQRSLATDPDNAQAQDDYAYSSNRIGFLLFQQGNYADALSHFRDSVKMYEKAAATDPRNLDLRCKVIILHGLIADTHAKLGNIAGALEELDKAIPLLQQTEVNPAHMFIRALQAQAYGWVGQTLADLARPTAKSKATQHWRTAREMFQRSLDIWQDLRARGTLAADDVPKVDEAVRQVAECDAALAEKK